MKHSDTIIVSLFSFVSIFPISLALIYGNSSISPEVFGYSTVGDFNRATFGGIYLTNFTSPSNFGTITHIIAYLSTGGTSLKTVIYSDNNGTPGNLLAESEGVYQEGTSGRWIDFPVSYTGAPNRVYWLGILFSSAGTYYFATGVKDKTIYSCSQTVATDVFPIGSSSPSNQLSIYAVYMPSSPQSLADSTASAETLLFVSVTIALIIAVALSILIFKTRKKNSKVN